MPNMTSEHVGFLLPTIQLPHSAAAKVNQTFLA